MTNAERAEAAAALAKAGVGAVSRETIERLVAFLALLREWQRAKNLVGPSALNDIWTRHVGDSAQLVAIAPDVRRWLDLGSGAGFPGLVTAILLADRPGAEVHLVESNARKCAFLQEAARTLGLPATAHRGRIETMLRTRSWPVEAISARALAPMAQLINWLGPLIAAGIPAFLHKGEEFGAEWEATPLRDRFVLVEHQSRFGPGVIVELRAAGAPPEET